MSYLHLYDFINLRHLEKDLIIYKMSAADLFVREVLLHDEGLVALGVNVAVAVLVLEPGPRRDGPLHYQHRPGPLSHPLVLDLCNLEGRICIILRPESNVCLGVSISHHGNQEVQEQHHQQCDEEEPVDLA